MNVYVTDVNVEQPEKDKLLGGSYISAQYKTHVSRNNVCPRDITKEWFLG